MNRSKFSIAPKSNHFTLYRRHFALLFSHIPNLHLGVLNSAAAPAQPETLLCQLRIVKNKTVESETIIEPEDVG